MTIDTYFQRGVPVERDTVQTTPCTYHRNRGNQYGARCNPYKGQSRSFLRPLLAITTNEVHTSQRDDHGERCYQEVTHRGIAAFGGDYLVSVDSNGNHYSRCRTPQHFDTSLGEDPEVMPDCPGDSLKAGLHLLIPFPKMLECVNHSRFTPLLLLWSQNGAIDFYGAISYRYHLSAVALMHVGVPFGSHITPPRNGFSFSELSG